ncbi:MAG: hypothetical protein ACKODX_20425 [Gemmata sp.]
MATTNSPTPGADPVKTKASDHDHHASGPPAPEVIARGYEEDVYDTKTVLSVPLLVVLFFVLAFGTVTVLFSIYSQPPAAPNAHPQAAARNATDLNTRIGRIKRGGEVDQPRLEPLRERTGDARIITRPEVPGVNSPELHPEDLNPTKDRFPELYPAEANRFSLDKAMALNDAALKALFKSSAPALPAGASRHQPTGANAGRGAEDSKAVPPKTHDGKKGTDPAPVPKGKEDKH